jgi:hypothetical protein
VVITPTVLFPAIITNTVQITNTVPPELNAADNSITQTTSIALPRTNKQIGRCGLTEYYDTSQGNFRIFYTRTYPNVFITDPGYPDPLPWDADCRILPPDKSNNPPPLDAGGYPAFVTILGGSLEESRLQYGSMNYPVSQIPVESGTNRYPVYVSSRPIWADLPIGNTPVNAPGITLPDHMFIANSDQYTTTQAITVDYLRTTGAHEYFHALQWTYVPNTCIGGIGGQYCTWSFSEELSWWMDATATWAQPRVYTNDGQYAWLIDKILSEPYRTLTASPVFDQNLRAYGSFIFATFLEQKVAEPRNPADGAHAIVRKTWEQYRTNNGGSMVNAIDQVLRRPEYGTTLPDAIPNFAWNNYFLNDGTYTRDVDAYKYFIDYNPAHRFQGKEWQLFRSWLTGGRENWQAGNAGVLTDPRRTYPALGPSANYSFAVSPAGTAYVEFMRPAAIGANTTLSVTLGVYLPYANVSDYIRVSALPIPIQGFNVLPHPNNQFLPSTYLSPGRVTYRYAFRVANFHQCDRTTLIINNLRRSDSFEYAYTAELIPPLPAPTTPCTLVVP